MLERRALVLGTWLASLEARRCGNKHRTHRAMITLSKHPDRPDLRSLRGARVVVTGATGFIGRHLCPELQAHGANLVLFSRERHATHSVLFPNARTVRLDLLDRQAICAALDNVKPDVVFHLAGFVSGDRNVKAMTRAFDGNVLPTASLLLCCAEKAPGTRVITTTSLDTSNPAREASRTGSAYGVSKLMVELLSGGLSRMHGLPFISARVGMAYGPNDPNQRRLVPAVIESLLRGESPRLGSGHRRCDWIYVDDVVTGLMAIASARSLPVPALDLGTGELCSVREVAETIRHILGTPLTIDYDPRLDRPNEQERSADVHHMRRLLGFHTHTELHAGLCRTVAWHRARQDDSVPQASGSARRRSLTRPTPESQAPPSAARRYRMRYDTKRTARNRG
jgi:UDP-glucose 4-epimerase